MLIQFRVENHRSIRDEQTLSMVAADLSTGEGTALLSTKAVHEQLLPVVAIYGANASGKSNVLQALSFAKDAVTMSHRRWDPDGGIPVDPFALSIKAAETSSYEFDLVVDEVRYRYGFSLSAKAVEEEWLLAWPRGRSQTWFERSGQSFKFGKHLGGENETIRALTRENSLFLSAAAQNNHELISPIYHWFGRVEIMRSGGAGSRRSLLYRIDTEKGSQFVFWSELVTGPQFRDPVLSLLRAADLGIVDIKLAERESDSGKSGIWVRHKGANKAGSWLRLEEESSGTITLFNLAVPLLYGLRFGGLVCVDELESSLHPSVALELVRLFNSSVHNTGRGQLVFTTHDTNLLGRELADEPVLRRDQIWFTEKDDEGATHLYPLTDFHPRKSENLERGYLQGRYGAVPYLSDFGAQLARESNEGKARRFKKTSEPND